MPDVKGLLSDPEFQKLDPATQKSTLGKLDPEFASLTDDQFSQFKSKLAPKSASQIPSWMTDRLPKKKAVPPVFDSNRTGGGESPEINDVGDRVFDAYWSALTVMGGGELAIAGGKALASGAIKQFLKSSIPKLVTGAVAGGLTKKGAELMGASPGVADAAGVAGGMAGMYGEGKIGAFLRSIPEDVAKGSWLNFAKWLAEKAKTDELAAKLLAESKKLPTPYTPRPGSPQTGTGNPPTGINPALKVARPGYRNPAGMPNEELSEADRRSIDSPPRRPGLQPATPAPAPTTGTGNPRAGVNPAMKRPAAGYRNPPARPSLAPATPLPGATVTMDASKVKEAADLVRSMNTTLDSLKSAPQSHWDAVAKQVGATADEGFKKAVMDELGVKVPKPNPKATISGPKTPKPTPGGEKVQSTVTPEARAAAPKSTRQS